MTENNTIGGAINTISNMLLIGRYVDPFDRKAVKKFMTLCKKYDATKNEKYIAKIFKIKGVRV